MAINLKSMGFFKKSYLPMHVTITNIISKFKKKLFFVIYMPSLYPGLYLIFTRKIVTLLVTCWVYDTKQFNDLINPKWEFG